MFQLGCKSLPHIIEAGPCARISGLNSKLEILPDLEPSVAKGHFGYRAVIESTVRSEIRLAIEKPVLTTTRDIPVIGLFAACAISQVERDNHLVIEELGIAFAVLNGIHHSMQKPFWS